MTLSLHFFNVGQGASLGGLLPSGGETFLVDVKEARVIARHFQDRKNLKFIVITHSDSDHLAGLLDLIDIHHFQVGKIYINFDRGPSAPDPDGFKLVMRRLHDWKLKGITNSAPINTDTKLDASGILKVIHPTYEFLAKMISLNKRNNSSVVIQVRYQGKTILLCGDIEEDGITELIRNNKGNLKCDVLKVPHHGAYPGSGTLEKLIDETKPEFAVISAGVGNKHGHPHGYTLKCLRSESVKKTFQTQEPGNTDAVAILVTIGDGGLTIDKYQSKDPNA